MSDPSAETSNGKPDSTVVAKWGFAGALATSFGAIVVALIMTSGSSGGTSEPPDANQITVAGADIDIDIAGVPSASNEAPITGTTVEGGVPTTEVESTTTTIKEAEPVSTEVESTTTTTTKEAEPVSTEVESTTTTIKEPEAECPDASISANKEGVNDTTPDLAVDSKTGTFFESSFDDWQTLQINFGCTGSFKALRRQITKPGVGEDGRGRQGESVSYSPNGTDWVELTATEVAGWENYVNYGARNHAWHSVPYGWSEWLTLNVEVDATAIRFSWDGDGDRLNEVEFMVDF